MWSASVDANLGWISAGKYGYTVEKAEMWLMIVQIMGAQETQ